MQAIIACAGVIIIHGILYCCISTHFFSQVFRARCPHTLIHETRVSRIIKKSQPLVTQKPVSSSLILSFSKKYEEHTSMSLYAYDRLILSKVRI